MILFALILVFIPFFSLPPFILANSYVQPLPLLIGWLILLVFNKVALSRGLLFVCVAYILYIALLKLGVYGLDGFSRGDFSVLTAYVIGLLSFVLFMGLFRRSELMRASGNMSLHQLIAKAIRLSSLSVSISVLLSILPPVNSLLTLVKPRTLELDDGGLGASFRGLSGLMPEPSYVGTALAVLYLSLFILTLPAYLPGEESHSCFRQTHSTGTRSQLLLRGYTACILFFLSSYAVDILLAFVAMLLTFSPTTLIVFTSIASLILIPYAIHFLLFLRLRGFLFRLLLLLFVAFVLFVCLSNFFFPSSRLASIITSVSSGDISAILLRDASLADRYASSAIGFTGLFYYPLGAGLNGHGAIVSDCSSNVIVELNLMCGSIYNSARSHNAIAAILVDGGVASFVFFAILLGKSLRRADLRDISTVSLMAIMLPLGILFAFVVLPAPLGAPFVWLPLSLAIQVLSGVAASSRSL
jgi:hypothetical protein